MIDNLSVSFCLSYDFAMMSGGIWNITKKTKLQRRVSLLFLFFVVLCAKHTIFLSFCNDLLFVKRKTKTKSSFNTMLHNNYSEINSNRARIVCPVYWKMCFQISHSKGVINLFKAIYLRQKLRLRLKAVCWLGITSTASRVSNA